jgi:hypothetical protein
MWNVRCDMVDNGWPNQISALVGAQPATGRALKFRSVPAGVSRSVPVWCRSGFLVRPQNCEVRPSATPCLTVRLERLGYHWTDLQDIWFEDVSKICRENSSVVKF